MALLEKIERAILRGGSAADADLMLAELRRFIRHSSVKTARAGKEVAAGSVCAARRKIQSVDQSLLRETWATQNKFRINTIFYTSLL